MHVIARPAITSATNNYSDAAKWLNAWWFVASKARWENLQNVRVEYPSVDQVGCCLVFNVCGRKYRLIVKVSYVNRWSNGTLLIKHFLSHAEYNKDRWKKDCCP